jgi:hypothetical protein
MSSRTVDDILRALEQFKDVLAPEPLREKIRFRGNTNYLKVLTVRQIGPRHMERYGEPSAALESIFTSMPRIY